MLHILKSAKNVINTQLRLTLKATFKKIFPFPNLKKYLQVQLVLQGIESSYQKKQRK